MDIRRRKWKYKKNPSFTQVHKGFSRVFRIPSSKSEENKYIERVIEEDEYVDKNGRLKCITIEYFGIEQNPFTLRVFLFLLAKLGVNKNNASHIEKLNAIDESNKDIVRKLEYYVEPYEESELTTLLKIETNYKELIEWFGMNYDNKAKNRLKRLLRKIQASAIKIVIKDVKSNRERKVRSNLLLYQSENNSRKHHKISIIFNPIAYLVLFENHPLKTTVNLEIFRELAKRDVNKTILFYVLSDNLQFGETKKIHIEDLFPLWTKPAKSKQTRHRRKRFIMETLEEIEELSGGTFKFDIDENDTIITAKRFLDRNST
ncbi:MAG: hypothetical protein JHC31_06000 [Sulfurihydrogenibium sp.]|nr:hypothetical protein [Sulfurihydrogenibium sp.]